MTAFFEARDIEKRFDGTGTVLDSVDVTVERGEILAVVGSNGSGKTVLLSILSGSEPPTNGRVRLEGDSIRERRDQVSFLAQDAMAIDALTGRENVSFYSALHPAFTDRWEEYVDRFEIADDLDTLVDEYSGGMRRKLELALALSVDASVYLLDEPTAALDMSMIQTLHSIVRSLQSEGRTIVFSSHVASDIDIADRLLFVRDGRIFVDGQPQTLVSELPPVVRLPRTSLTDSIQEQLVNGAVFDDGAEARGFLRQDVTAESMNALVTEGSGSSSLSQVQTVEPTYEDLFNYFGHVIEAPE